MPDTAQARAEKEAEVEVESALVQFKLIDRDKVEKCVRQASVRCYLRGWTESQREPISAALTAAAQARVSAESENCD